ncbi:MAG: alpha-hydroxy-acid oxidizing protein [Acidimicrobiia bacterium]|nr:alpha-hydroxy-acid oxidizing protein [Acidimicrobiia bacterium]
MNPLRSFRSLVRFRPIELRSSTRRLARAASVDDLRRQARRRLPRAVFDYIDGGAEDERTLDRNVSGYARLEFRPRVLRDMSNLDTSISLFGRSLPTPLILAPTGFTRIADPEGELAVARAAARVGVPYNLSTMGTRSIEEVAAVSNGPKWFQVYAWRDRGLIAELVGRARDAGYEAIMLTVDTAVLGRRERDVRLGTTLPPKIGLNTIVDGIIHPAWTYGLVTNEPITFANVAGRHGLDGSSAITLADYAASQFDPALSWDQVEWLRSQWDGPIILKGVQTVADAELAVAHGVEGIAISNHGGRQLDDAPPVVELIEPVAQAVAGRSAIIADGGIRRGGDILKSLALGADAVMVGRAYLYGLGAAGEAGVDHVLAFLLDGLRRTMALTGCRTIGEIEPDLVTWRRDDPSTTPWTGGH